MSVTPLSHLKEEGPVEKMEKTQLVRSPACLEKLEEKWKRIWCPENSPSHSKASTMSREIGYRRRENQSLGLQDVGF